MNYQETCTLLDLAHRLGSTPRRVLIAAARMIEHAESDAPDCLRRIQAGGIHRNILVDDCAKLMLTPVDSYARDATSKALLALWPGSGQTG